VRGGDDPQIGLERAAHGGAHLALARDQGLLEVGRDLVAPERGDVRDDGRGDDAAHSFTQTLRSSV
jgi:hypothetical protein